MQTKRAWSISAVKIPSFSKKKREIKKPRKVRCVTFCLADFGMLNPLVENSVEYSVYLAGIRSHLNDRPLEESDNIK